MVLTVAKVTADTVPPSQTTWSPGSLTWPLGLTVIVNVCGVPSHGVLPLVKRGVTVIVAVTGNVPRLVAVNDPMLPLPLPPSPIVGSLLDHVYVVVPPVLAVVKMMAVVAAPLHTTWSPGSLTWPNGLTVMVKVTGVPSHADS